MAKNIEVKGTNVRILAKEESDYISLTDIAHYKEPGRTDHVIQNWMRNRNTVEFLGIWEQLNNPNEAPRPKGRGFFQNNLQNSRFHPSDKVCSS